MTKSKESPFNASFLPSKSAAVYLGLSVHATLIRSRLTGKLLGKPAPPWIKLGDGPRDRIGYETKALDEWLDKFNLSLEYRSSWANR